MRKFLLLILVLVLAGIYFYNQNQCHTQIPEFTDEMNHAICIEDGIL